MEIVQGQPRQLREPSPVRRPSFPKSLLEERKFIDPELEVQRKLIVSEQTTSSPAISLEMAQSPRMRRAEKRESLFTSMYEYLFAVISQLQRKFGKSRRARARLTKLGSATLEQLRYLSLLCDASEYRTPEEVLAAESAFGEAYYEVMTLSGNLEKMTEKESEHHLRNYMRQMSKVLNAAD